MANLYNASEYKNKIINLLLKNKNLIKVINPCPSECEDIDIIDVLLGGKWIIDGKVYEEQGHIFDYEFVNETITDEKTFIFVETDISGVRDDTFADFNLYIFIFTSKNLVRLSSDTIPSVAEIKDMGYFASRFANRIDVLCDIVDRIFNNTDELYGIGNVQPAPRGYCTLYRPNNKYYGKCLKYCISNYNDAGDNCGN